jgi:uncharacterized protein with GYD domain
MQGRIAVLFCITANYTPKALEAIAKKRSTNRLFEKMLAAAGGKLLGMYATMADGPGAMAIFDADPAVAPAVGSVVAMSDGVHNFKMQRLFTMEEVTGMQQKRAAYTSLRAVLPGR